MYVSSTYDMRLDKEAEQLRDNENCLDTNGFLFGRHILLIGHRE